MIDKALRDGLTDALIVKGHIIVGRYIRDRAVIGDHHDELALRQADQSRCSRRTDRVKYDDLCPLA